MVKDSVEKIKHKKAQRERDQRIQWGDFCQSPRSICTFIVFFFSNYIHCVTNVETERQEREERGETKKRIGGKD